MSLRVLIVQHADKERSPDDPGLTELGHAQAVRTARWLERRAPTVAIWSSPLRRALETAAPIADAVALELRIESRLRERMNWAGTAVVVAHGGVTTDALRTLLGDVELRARAPRLIDGGVPCCAVTALQNTDEGWTVESIALIDHLA